MFKTILVALDELESGRAASRFAAELSGTFDASVQVFHPSEPSGLTRGARDHRLAGSIAAEAGRVQADLIVLGLERPMLGRHHRSGSVRQQLGTMTHLPIMAAPTAAERPAHQRGEFVRKVVTGRGMLTRSLHHV